MAAFALLLPLPLPLLLPLPLSGPRPRRPFAFPARPEDQGGGGGGSGQGGGRCQPGLSEPAAVNPAAQPGQHAADATRAEGLCRLPPCGGNGGEGTLWSLDGEGTSAKSYRTVIPTGPFRPSLYCMVSLFIESQVIVTQFFNSVMTAANACSQPGTPVISVYLNHEKRYAFVEFRYE